MNSFKVASFLLVVGLSKSAPQISQQGLVSQVLGQLQPSIARTIAELLSSRTTSTLGLAQGVSGDVKSSAYSFGEGATGSVSTTSLGQEITNSGAVSSSSSKFEQGATGSVRASSLGQGSNSAVRTSNIEASRVPSTKARSDLSSAQLTSSVVDSLQPSIAAAVADALRASSIAAENSKRTSTNALTTSVSALSEEEEAKLNAQLSANVQYKYGYKVADDDSQSYMAHEETRDGQDVEGKYNYVDANGALVTVTYKAGPMGYTENREVQDGAVQMRTTYGPWSGPFADTVPAGVSSTSADLSKSSVISTRQQSSSVSQSDLIAEILSKIQPQINSAVQSALSTSSSRTDLTSSSGSSSGSSFQSTQTNSNNRTRQSFSVDQSKSSLIASIIGALQPQISGVVQAAISSGKQTSVSFRPTPVVAVQATPVRRVTPVVAVQPAPISRIGSAAVGSGLTNIFGVAGQNNVRIETPDFTIGY